MVWGTKGFVELKGSTVLKVWVLSTEVVVLWEIAGLWVIGAAMGSGVAGGAMGSGVTGGAITGVGRWFKKYDEVKSWQLEQKVIFLLCENKNRTILPQLPECKGSEKWQKTKWKTKLSLQEWRM